MAARGKLSGYFACAIRRFARDARGATVFLIALFFPAIFVAVGNAIDHATLGAHASGVDIKTSATVDPLAVTVDLKQSFDGIFLNQILNSQLGAHSVARVSGSTALGWDT